jgi:hypothetical protein
MGDVKSSWSTAKTQNTGTSSVRGARAGESFDSEETIRKKKWLEDYDTRNKVGGIGGRSKQTPEYRKKRDEEGAKSGWGNVK